MMGFDGAPRPAQFIPQSDGLNPYTAANLARQDQSAAPRVKGPTAEDPVRSLPRERQDNAQADGDEGESSAFSEEEAEQIRLLAKMRGILNFSLDSGTRYEFHLNPQTGFIDLRVLRTGEVVLQLTPDELMRLSEKIRRYAGMLADRAG
jgi:hypothetical protein